MLVAAVANNGAIGNQGALPWQLPDDLRRFRRLTVGGPVVMGRSTFESIGRPLPERTNIVLTRNPDFAPKGVHPVAHPERALVVAAQEHGDADVCVIGGSQIYRLYLDVADRMELTFVEASPEADTFFPQWDRQEWNQVFSENRPGPPPFEFATYVRRAVPGAALS